MVFSASGIWSSLIPLRKNPHMFRDCVWARAAPSHCAHFAPPEMPANTTGHCVDFGQSRCTTSNPAARSASLQPTESFRGRIVASVASTIQPSAVAGARYHGASEGPVCPASLVAVTIRIGQARRESKFGGSNNKRRPVVGAGLPSCAAYCW